MAFDGNGNWISNFSAEADRDAGYKILASRFDNIFIADIAQSFENCLTKDTQVKPIQPFDANNFRIINVANPSANTDAVNLATLNTKDGTAVHKAGTETISGNKTFSGTSTFSGNISSSAANTFSGINTFSGSVSLGSSATATTPAYSDSDTSVATTAMVHNLNDTQRTNCITEIPQDIKLELSSGTLTLKAGSKVYMPNGSGVFDTVTLTTDKTTTISSNGVYFICVAHDASAIASRPVSSCTSGAGATAVSGFAYNTTTNKINNFSGAGTIGNQYTFPIAIITVSNGAISSIDQVFNGFGFIGATIFALPGVKILAPYGRNADGTLKSCAYTLQGVKTRNSPGTNIIAINSIDGFFGVGPYEYDPVTNYNYSGGSISDRRCIIGQTVAAGGVVTSFTTKPAFHAVDYSDFKQADDNNVKLTGNQIIDGTKTFLNNPYLLTRGTGGRYYSKNTDLDLTNTSRASDIGIGFRSVDKNDNTAGEFTNVFTTSGTSSAVMQVRNRASGSQVIAQLKVNIDKNGNISTECPTPSSATDNSTKIATTAWVNSHLSNATTKATIANYAMPNYASGVSITSGWSSTGNGVLVCTIDFTESVSGSVSVGGVNILGVATSLTHDMGNHTITMAAPVAKGKSVTFSNATVKFYPCVGG